jgi:hypothetical protein
MGTWIKRPGSIVRNEERQEEEAAVVVVVAAGGERLEDETLLTRTPVEAGHWICRDATGW